MNATIETTLLLNLFYVDNGVYSRNDVFIEARRRKAIALLDEDAHELKAIDPDLSQEYQETVRFLESLSDEAYQSLKEKVMTQMVIT